MFYDKFSSSTNFDNYKRFVFFENFLLTQLTEKRTFIIHTFVSLVLAIFGAEVLGHIIDSFARVLASSIFRMI